MGARAAVTLLRSVPAHGPKGCLWVSLRVLARKSFDVDATDVPAEPNITRQEGNGGQTEGRTTGRADACRWRGAGYIRTSRFFAVGDDPDG